MDRAAYRGYTACMINALHLMATCCPGLEFILADEIRERLGVETSAERGKVFFAALPGEVMSSRCADNLYTFAGQVGIGATRPDLPEFARALEHLPLEPLLERLRPLGITPQRIHVTASRAGKHSYSRFEAAAAALPALCAAAGGQPGDELHHTCAFRLDIEGALCRAYIKLTPPDFRFRGARDFSPAALRPTIAHALVRLTGPKPGDVFVDPFCGSGTMLSERAQLPHAAVIGGDIDPEAADTARRNAPECDVRVWDAAHLPLEDESVDAVATNPPWGKQIAVADQTRLYRDFVAELCRVCRAGARIVVLTDKEADLVNAFLQYGWAVDKLAALSLHGTLAGVFRTTLP